MLIFAFVSASLAQECPAGCIDEATLPPECLPPVPACPLQAFGGTIGSALPVSWLYDNGTWGSSPNGTWMAEPYSVQSPYSATNFTYPMIGEGASSGASEWSCAITSPNGALNCFGDFGVVNHPTGEEPYSALSSGSIARFGVLNNLGQIRVWGATTGGFGSPPTGSGYVDLGIGRDVGCVVGPTVSGVLCWGSTSTGWTVLNANRPTTGTYTRVEVGREIAMAVQDDGTLDIWCDPNQAACPSFKANGPVAGQRGIPAGMKILNAEINETGSIYGAAMLEDMSVYLWTASTTVTPEAIHHAIMFDDYGTPADRWYIPQGPNGRVTWRSAVSVTAFNSGRMCGVIDDPAGSVDGSSNLVPYEFGEVVCWGGSNAGQYPARYAFCNENP